LNENNENHIVYPSAFVKKQNKTKKDSILVYRVFVIFIKINIINYYKARIIIISLNVMDFFRLRYKRHVIGCMIIQVINNKLLHVHVVSLQIKY
jgi:hypothetical protein